MPVAAGVPGMGFLHKHVITTGHALGMGMKEVAGLGRGQESALLLGFGLSGARQHGWGCAQCNGPEDSSWYPVPTKFVAEQVCCKQMRLCAPSSDESTSNSSGAAAVLALQQRQVPALTKTTAKVDSCQLEVVPQPIQRLLLPGSESTGSNQPPLHTV
jgi:hypothetical protein